MTDTPADELRAAAEKLRALAKAATDGPWRYHDTHLPVGGHTATVLTDREDINQTELLAWVPTWSHEPWDTARNAWNNAIFIAAMHPGVGATLADLLDRAAEHVRQQYLCCDHGEHKRSEIAAPAIVVARAILGSAS